MPEIMEPQRPSTGMIAGLLEEARFPDPLPVDDRFAREWGYLQSVVLAAGPPQRHRTADIATARVHQVALMTHNLKDFSAISHLLQIVSSAA
jgi:predicted nucleic acid-binding protein